MRNLNNGFQNKYLEINIIKLNLDKSNSNNINFHKIFKIIDSREILYNPIICVKNNFKKVYDTLKILILTIYFYYYVFFFVLENIKENKKLRKYFNINLDKFS